MSSNSAAPSVSRVKASSSKRSSPRTARIEPTAPASAALSREDKHERARAAILAVSAKLFFERGYAGTTMDEIARQLKMTKPFIYYYFKDKGAIYATLCLEAADATLSSVPASMNGQPVSAVLHETFRRLTTANMHHFEASSLYYREPQVLAAAVRKKILTRARDFNKAIRSLIEEGKRQGELSTDVNSALAALSVAGVVAFMYRWYDPKGDFTPERMADELAAIMMRIIGAPASNNPVKARP